MISGPNLPSQIEKSTMITSPNGQGVVLIGGYLNWANLFSKSMIELWGNNLENLKWITLKQTLQFARRHHVAFLVPDDFANSKIPEIRQEKVFSEINYNNISDEEELIRNSKKKCILS